MRSQCVSTYASSSLEEDVQEFWRVSRAWRRDPEFVGSHSFSSIMASLEPLRLQGRFHTLRQQADSLANLAVSGKIRRKKGTIKSKVVKVDFSTQTSPQLKRVS